MSKSSKAGRARSGSHLRPLGATRLSHGPPPHTSGPQRNDPALLINQLQTLRTSSPPNQLKEKEREFKAREQKLKDHIAALEKLIAELKFELKTKSDILEGLKKTLDLKIKYYEDKIAEKDAECTGVKEELEISQGQVEVKQKQMDSLIVDYEEKIKELLEKHHRDIKELEEEKKAELKERDDKLDILKKRMAEAIGKNSNARQQQLEELKKDLIKASQEARDLHHQLKHLQMHPPKCQNCISLEAKLDEKSLQVRLKDKTINDLQNIGKSMQLQLHQQDVVLSKWEEREKRESQS